MRIVHDILSLFSSYPMNGETFYKVAVSWYSLQIKLWQILFFSRVICDFIQMH